MSFVVCRLSCVLGWCCGGLADGLCGGLADGLEASGEMGRARFKMRRTTHPLMSSNPLNSAAQQHTAAMSTKSSSPRLRTWRLAMAGCCGGDASLVAPRDSIECDVLLADSRRVRLGDAVSSVCLGEVDRSRLARSRMPAIGRWRSRGQVGMFMCHSFDRANKIKSCCPPMMMSPHIVVADDDRRGELQASSRSSFAFDLSSKSTTPHRFTFQFLFALGYFMIMHIRATRL